MIDTYTFPIDSENRMRLHLVYSEATDTTDVFFCLDTEDVCKWFTFPGTVSDTKQELKDNLLHWFELSKGVA